MEKSPTLETLSDVEAFDRVRQFAPDDELATELIAETMEGSTTAARRLLHDVWPDVLRRVSTAAGEPHLLDTDREALLTYLTLLPRLATVYERPGQGLAEWALVTCRDVLGAPVAYPRKRELDRSVFLSFSRALLTVAEDDAGDVAKVKRILGLTNAEVGQLLRVSGSAVSAWDRGQSSPRPAVAKRLAELVELATVMDQELLPERVPALFSSTPVPLLGGRSYRQSLLDGESGALLADIVRLGAGVRPRTAAGWALALGISDDDAEALVDQAVSALDKHDGGQQAGGADGVPGGAERARVDAEPTGGLLPAAVGMLAAGVAAVIADGGIANAAAQRGGSDASLMQQLVGGGTGQQTRGQQRVMRARRFLAAQ